MGTVIRPEISERNQYWVSKHRYYELKHFCLQYNDWVKLYNSLDGVPKNAEHSATHNSNFEKPTECYAISRAWYSERIEMIKAVAKEAAGDLWESMLKAVTEGLSYEHMMARTYIPCSKDAWYELYRKFFWILDKVRG